MRKKINNYSQRIVAVIPARGGSVGIPRKNARIIGGKPLLAHAIEICLQSSEIDDVFVSTEDAELSEIAIRYNAKVLKRPDSLADSSSTLDDVIVHAGNQLEDAGEVFKYLVTIQATSPLLKPAIIDYAVQKCRDENLDTVLTVMNIPHLAWTKNPENKIIPLYKSRVNRQELPPYYRETGGIVVASRETLISGSRFGIKIGIVETNKAESIDIDDYFDWWLAEKSLSRRRICFHIIGSKGYGLGHVYRALTIADRLIDHNIWFLINDKSQLAEQMIKERFYPAVSVSPGGEANTIISDAPHLVINDVLDTDESLMGPLKEAGIPTINFEDMGEGCSFADYVINAMYDSPVAHTAMNTLNGAKYCCLRDEFYSIHPKKVDETVNNILLLFGGTDPNGLTLKCLKWIDELEGNWSMTVVLGLGFRNPEKVLSLTENLKHRTEVVQKTSVISRYMAKADIAVTSSGRTVFELGSLGVPMIAIAENEREMTHDFVQKSPGVIFLGLGSNLTRKAFRKAITQLISSDILRKKMNQCLLEAGLRHGIDHVLGVIETVLKNTSTKSGG